MSYQTFRIILRFLLFTTFCNISVLGHGALWAPYAVTGNDNGYVRNINLLHTDISSLRSPMANDLICRGATRLTNPPTIKLVNGEDYTITLAMSLGAQHVGPCSVEIRDADNLNAPGVTIASVSGRGCATMPIAEIETNKGSKASAQCPGQTPKGNELLDDMCLTHWTFTVQNAKMIQCKNCVLRWTWVALHIPSSPEYYENCADVIINNQNSNPVVQTLVQNKDTVTNNQNSNSVVTEIKPTHRRFRKSSKMNHPTLTASTKTTTSTTTTTTTTSTTLLVEQKANIEHDTFSNCDNLQSGYTCISLTSYQACLGRKVLVAEMSCALGTQCSNVGPGIIQCQ